VANRRVLVTGSSRGIGRAIAQKLAADGWSVALHYTSHEAEALALKEELGGRCSGVYRQDLSNPSRAANLIEEALQDGPLYALVNNAGVYLPMDFLETGDAAFEANLSRTMAINFESPLRLIRAACKHFQESGSGKILNVASRVGFRGEPGAALYAASKAGLINLTRSLAVELAPKNIGVFGIAPGWVETAMVRDEMDRRLPGILATIPLGRMASVRDCAAAAAFLLSEEAAYLSGQVIDINGASYFH
jgi:3-oxoacyl-[acyl-carrier protein] reductase